MWGHVVIKMRQSVDDSQATLGRSQNDLCTMNVTSRRLRDNITMPRPKYDNRLSVATISDDDAIIVPSCLVYWVDGKWIFWYDLWHEIDASHLWRSFKMNEVLVSSLQVPNFLSSFLSPEYRFMVGITGQGIAALAYPFIMFLPTKVKNFLY